MRVYSRRGVIAGLISLLWRRDHSAATEVLSRGSFVRVYRTDAVILLLGLPIYRRAGVGAAKAALEETGAGPDLRRTLFFAGGSDPKRARGLSRLGWMREVVAGPAAAPSDISYFGVLTSSPEESLENARKSSDPPAGRSLFDAVSGRNTVGRSRSAITQFDFASSAAWSDQALIDRAQSLFRGDVKWRDTSWPNSPQQAPPTFLLQVASLLKQRAKRASGRYVYNEQEYLLELEAHGPGRDRLLPFRGKIRNLRTGYETKFKVWLEDGSESIVPVRIEFQPRSFLKLTFEAVPA
jgi:hypothetical protein